MQHRNTNKRLVVIAVLCYILAVTAQGPPTVAIVGAGIGGAGLLSPLECQLVTTLSSTNRIHPTKGVHTI